MTHPTPAPATQSCRLASASEASAVEPTDAVAIAASSGDASVTC